MNNVRIFQDATSLLRFVVCLVCYWCLSCTVVVLISFPPSHSGRIVVANMIFSICCSLACVVLLSFLVEFLCLHLHSQTTPQPMKLFFFHSVLLIVIHLSLLFGRYCLLCVSCTVHLSISFCHSPISLLSEDRTARSKRGRVSIRLQALSHSLNIHHYSILCSLSVSLFPCLF